MGYIHFGKATLSGYGARLTAESGGLTLGVAFDAPLSASWGLNVRAGVADVKTELDASIGGYGYGSYDEKNVAPYYGFGVSYAFTPNAKLVLAADFSRAEADGEKADVRAVTLGLRLDF